jgi:tetratricopeptide (TPR) repeat protein
MLTKHNRYFFIATIIIALQISFALSSDANARSNAQLCSDYANVEYDYAKGVEACKMAVAQDKRDIDSIYNLGKCYNRTEKPEQAYDVLKRAQSLESRPDKLLNISKAMAESLVKLNKPEEALKIYEHNLRNAQIIDDYQTVGDSARSMLWVAIDIEKLNEKDFLKFFDRRLSPYFKDEIVRVRLFTAAILMYIKKMSSNSSFNWQTTANDCIYTSEYGSVYHGCKKIIRVSHSSLISKKDGLDESSLVNVLVALAYAEDTKSMTKKCDINGNQRLQAIGSMLKAEQYLMAVKLKYPLFYKKLVTMLKGQQISFDSLAQLCE